MNLDCPIKGCGRGSFKSPRALRMHLMRGHGWSVKAVDEHIAAHFASDNTRALQLGPSPVVVEGVAAAVGEMLLDGTAPYVIEIELDDDEILIAQACAYVDEHDDVASMIAAWLTDSLAKFAELPSVKLALEARRVNDVEGAA